MALIIGFVTVNDDGSYTGSDMSLALFEAQKAAAEAAPTPKRSQVLTTERSLADFAVALATGMVPYINAHVSAGGSGDVTGPGSSVNLHIVVFNGTTGKVVQDGGVAVSDLAAATRNLTAGTGLTGGGNLTADRTFACDFGTGATQVCVGNDSRLSNARTPTAHATSHQNGGTDEVATATAAANAIPKASGTGKLDIGWIPTGSSSTTVCIGNDSRLSDSRTPTGSAGGGLTGTYPNPSVDPVIAGQAIAAPVSTTFSTSVANVDTTVYTVPASPSGIGRFNLMFLVIRLETAITGGGTVTITAGTSTGGNDLMTSVVWNSSTPVGTEIGWNISTLGTSFLATQFYTALLDASATVKVRYATGGGGISAGAASARVYGALVT